MTGSRGSPMSLGVLSSMMLFALALALAPGTATAAMLGDAAVSYSAERTVVVNGHSYTGMVFHTPGHDRHEQEIQGIPEVILLDAAAKQGILLLPGLNSYLPFAFPRLMAELDDPTWRRVPKGDEVVNGVRTTKYRVDHTAEDGSHAQGWIWLSAQGVLMRLDGVVRRAGASAGTSIRMELAGLRLGRQDPQLFQIPPGLIKLPSGALEGLLSGRSG
jgi:hypothetical protein